MESRSDGQVEESLEIRRKNGCIKYLGTVEKIVKGKVKFPELCDFNKEKGNMIKLVMFSTLNELPHIFFL